MRVLEPLLQQQPSDVRALTLMGMALTTAGKPKDANARFRQALAANPQFAPALRGLAINEMALGLAQEAKQHFEQLVKLTPGDPVAQLALGELAFRDKQYAQSVQHFEQSQGLHLRDPRNVVNYADASIRAGQPQKAEAALRQMPDGADPALYLEAGGLLVKMSRFDAAAAQFEKAARSHPDRYLVGYNLALAQLKAKSFDAAIRTAESLIAAGHRKPELYNLLGHAYEGGGRTKDAYDALRTAATLEPLDEINYLDLIGICVAHKNLDLALEIADAGIARVPSSDRLHLQRGVVWAMKGDFEKARAAFESAARLAPKKALPQISLGLVLMQVDRPADAVQVLEKTASASPDDYLVHWFLGEALNRAGVEPGSPMEKEAIASLTTSVRLKPDQVQPRVLLAKMLTRRGQLDEAHEQLEQALKLEPDSVPATYQLAQVLQKKGDTARARELFARVSKAKAEEREQFASRGLQQIVREGAR
jgi:tetratricopeptide (TPR) repeat protein